MLQIFGAGLVFKCDENFSIIHNGAIAFEEGQDSIIKVGDYKELCALYPHAQKTFLPNGVLLPALINAHIHFEFGAHFAEFSYGDFGVWLDSLMQKRDALLGDGIESIITQGIKEQVEAGVGSVGAISSYGNDMLPLAKSPLRVVYFNEAIGSNPSAIDFLYKNLISRLEEAKTLASSRFIPALALHSPYSLHPIMAQKLITIATQENYPLSAHFLESSHEREWLTQSSGYFKGFFQRLAGLESPKSFYTPQSFLEMLSPIKHLSLTHCLYITEEEVRLIDKLGGAIITCPRSNRLLNNRFFPHKLIRHTDIPLAIGTDGKSSNNNVNLLDELRASLYAYPNEDMNKLACRLLLSATLYGAKALGLNNGTLEEGKSVDFALFDFIKPLVSQGEALSRSALHFILHSQKPSRLYINTKAVL